MSFISLKSVKKNYGQFVALRGVDLELERGGQYAILGASGSGKSTLMYLIGGLDRPSEGEVTVDDLNLLQLNDEALAQYRNLSIGFVFQFHFLLPSMNCLQNILLPAKIAGLPEKEIIREVHGLAENLGVSHCLTKFPYELSGGEQQRINIIRALSLKPKILLCDEPTGNLDSENSQIVTKLLKSLAKKYGSTLIVVTHDQNVSQHFEQKFYIRDGLIVTP